MHHTITASRNTTFARILAVVSSAAFALAGCAVDGASTSEEADATETTADALKSGGGGGGGLGFTCENGVCTCSKSIEGDCDKMVINCTSDLTSFNNCLKGWLTTDCSCTQKMTAPPRPRAPIGRPIGGLLLSQ